MKCLTVMQPWATAIVQGPKHVENRTFSIAHRGDLLIHAGKGQGWMTGSACMEVSLLWAGFPSDVLSATNAVPFGDIVGVVELFDCVHKDDLWRRPDAAKYNAWACGPWCWLLRNKRAFRKPIQWRGQQGIYDVPDTVVQAEITAAVPWRDRRFGEALDVAAKVPQGQGSLFGTTQPERYR